MRKTWYADAIERVTWTFVQAFLATWIVTQDFNLETAKVAAVAGAVAVAKCLMATQIGSANTAATLPVLDDTPVEGPGD